MKRKTKYWDWVNSHGGRENQEANPDQFMEEDVLWKPQDKEDAWNKRQLVQEMMKELSPGEVEVASLIMEGFETGEIAQLLNKSSITVAHQIQNIRKKLSGFMAKSTFRAVGGERYTSNKDVTEEEKGRQKDKDYYSHDFRLDNGRRKPAKEAE